MLLRGGSGLQKEQFQDSGYNSDPEPHFEPEHTGSRLLFDAHSRHKKDHASNEGGHNSDDFRQNGKSFLAQAFEATSRNSSFVIEGLDKLADAQDQVNSVICETDSEDELPLEYSIPFTASKDFPIVPLPSTLARAGYNAAAMEVERLYDAKDRYKVKARKSALRELAPGHGGVGDKPVPIGVVVSSKRTRYSLADALEDTEERFQAEDEDEDEGEGENEEESESEYV